MYISAEEESRLLKLDFQKDIIESMNTEGLFYTGKNMGIIFIKGLPVQ